MDTRSKKNLQWKVCLKAEEPMPPLNKLKSGAFTLEFKRELPQNVRVDETYVERYKEKK